MSNVTDSTHSQTDLWPGPIFKAFFQFLPIQFQNQIIVGTSLFQVNNQKLISSIWAYANR